VIFDLKRRQRPPGAEIELRGLVAQRFVAVIFGADRVGVAMPCQLGPLMTAIGVTGRTGGAVAAQMGAHKINEGTTPS
jgi:ABC-type transporter Mla maintaining outer membrane lipid asymmetry permease subunit MlaE